MHRFTSHAVPGLMGAGLLLCGATAPNAQTAPPAEAAAMADFYTGTLEIDTMSGEWSAKRYLAPDHTYREAGSDGAVSGTWKIEGGKICTTSSKPLGDDRAKTYCNAGVGKKAGQAWRDQDPVTGGAVLFKLTPGRPAGG